MSAESRSTELDGRPVVEVVVRDRPPWTRGPLAPHHTEIILRRPESPYRQLVFTVPEWGAFLADVKADLFDLAQAVQP